MSAAKPVEIRALSGARALPPLILVLFHFFESHGYRGTPWFDLIIAKGYLWVEFFFALSGFVLVYAYAARTRDLWTARGYFTFIWSRLSRLYPLHLFMLLAILLEVIVFGALARAGGYVSIFDQPYHPVLTAETFVASLFLVQAWNLFPYLSWNQISWFVSVEFLLCLAFPLYLLASRGGRIFATVVALAGVLGLVLLDLGSTRGLDLTFHNSIWRGASAFATGVVSAAIFLAPRSQKPLSYTGISLIQLGVVSALLSAIWFSGLPKTNADIFTAIPMLALVPALATDRWILASALKTQLATRLGQWSYGIFIGQLFWMNLDRFAEQHLFPSPKTIVFGTPFETIVWWLEPLGILLICIAWGALLTRAVEAPANAAMRRLVTRQNVREPLPA